MTLLDESHVWINPNAVKFIQAVDEHTKLYFIDGTYVECIGDPQAIATLISGAMAAARR